MTSEDPTDPAEASTPGAPKPKPKRGRGGWAFVAFLVISVFTLVPAFVDEVMGRSYMAVFRLVAGAVIFWWVLVALYPRLRRRWVLIVTGCVSLAALASTGREPLERAFHNSIPTVGTEVDIRQYEPFTPEAKLALLKEPASLKLSEKLPILDGATALYPVYAAFAQAVYPEGVYHPLLSEVRMQRTIAAYEALGKGQVDLIFAAGPNKAQQQAVGANLELTPIGREAFVFFVHAKNPVDGLTSAQIRDIYAGRITNWREVGGPDAPIRAYQRNPGSGSQSALVRFMGDTPIQHAPTEDVPQFMGRIVSEVADYRNYKNAIGFSFRFYTTGMLKNDQIKLLAIDGHAPTRENIRSGEYPITENLYAVSAGSQNPNIKPLIQWILSPQGQQLIEDTGYVGIASPE